MYYIKCHYCQGDECFNQYKLVSNKFCLSKTGKCFISVDLTNEVITHQRGCVANDLFCIYNRGQHLSNGVDAYLKCCDTEFCNNEEFIMFKSAQKSLLNDWIIIIFIIILLSIFSSLIVYSLKKFIRKKCTSSNINHLVLDEKVHLNKEYKPEVKVTSPSDSILHEVLEESCTSGSGGGKTLLMQRTFAKQISLIECVGKGRYGEVWKGMFQYEEIAVKIFFSRDEASFQREIEIYSSSLHKHENILTYFGSDVTSKNSCTQLWLVTAYHELGSLFDYLNNYTINLEDMFSIMTSIASGITYLHTENFGTQKKLAIAHRDIKSKNILMKTKNICCIADFGLAVTKQKTGSLNIACNYRVGTKRYMAPEVLDGSFSDKNFDSFTKADIYSFSLVLWEIIRRLESKSQSALNYEVPYQHKVPSDPSFEDMRKVVCIEQYRPDIPAELNNHQISLNPILNIIRESWSKNPSSRLSALRIKKSLKKERENASV